MPASIHRQIAEALSVREQQVEAAVALLDGGATVPFISRYRKEATGALDDAQLRTLEERLHYLRELEERRTIILNSIREQGRLDVALEKAILAADSKGRLEDIYLPYKPKRRTKAEVAKEAGLGPLADLLLARPESDPQAAGAAFVDADKQVPDAAAALEGARAILVERFAEDGDLIGSLRELMWSSGRITSQVRKGKKESGAKFSDYFDFSEALTKLPSHRILALFRGEKEGDPRGRHRAGRLRADAGQQKPVRIAHHAPLRYRRPRPSWRPLAHRDRELGLAHQDHGAPFRRPARAFVECGGTGGRAGVCRQPARSHAGSTCRRAPDNGSRSRLSDRREGRRGRCDRQGRGDRRHLSARAAAPMG